MSKREEYLSTDQLLSIAAAVACVILLVTSRSWALHTATGLNGARVLIVRQANTFNLNGNGISLGQVESGRPGDPQIANDLNHPAVNPCGAAVGVFQVNAAGTGLINPVPAMTWGNQGNFPASGLHGDDHAMAVAGAMVSTNVNSQGAAPGATIFSAAMAQIGGSAVTANNMITGF